jgi:hypothetical protein
MLFETIPLYTWEANRGLIFDEFFHYRSYAVELEVPEKQERVRSTRSCFSGSFHERVIPK